MRTKSQEPRASENVAVAVAVAVAVMIKKSESRVKSLVEWQ